MSYKDGVREFQPHLPADGILLKNDQSREWLLAKCKKKKTISRKGKVEKN